MPLRPRAGAARAQGDASGADDGWVGAAGLRDRRAGGHSVRTLGGAHTGMCGLAGAPGEDVRAKGSVSGSGGGH